MATSRTSWRVRHPGRADWGPGVVLSGDESGRLTVFFLAGGKRRIDTRLVRLERLAGLVAVHPVLAVAEQVDWDRARHSVYVIELSPTQLGTFAAFRNENPGWDGARPAVYVGLTGLTPEERFENHKRGYKSSRYVSRYHLRLLPELYEHFNPMPHDLAKAMEPELARQLRQHGFGVWQK